MDEQARRNEAATPDIGKDLKLASTIVDALDTLVVVMDAEGRVLYFNRACEAASGYTTAEVAGRHLIDLLVPETEREGVRAVFEELRGDRGTSHYQNHWLTKDGKQRFIAWSNIVSDMHSGASCVIGTGIDLTDQRAAETELRERKRYFEALVETMTDGLVVDDFESGLSYVNRRFCDLIGYPREELIGRPVADFVDPANISILEAQNERRKRGQTVPYELTFRHRDGGTVDLLVSPQLLQDDNGKMTASFAVLTDLTPIRRVEEQRALLATAIEQSGESVIITGVDGEIRYVNPAFEEVTGYTRDEVIGRNPSILKSGEHGDEFYRELWETISSGEVWTGTFVNRAKDGSRIEEDGTISPVRSENGEIVAYVAVKREVSEERVLADQLERAQKLEAVGLLAGGIAHDFNNILMAIAGSVDVIGLRSPKELANSDEILTIRKTVERGAELTRRLLSVARQQTLELKSFDINDTVEREVDILRRVLPESIEILFLAGEGPLMVRGDRGQLAQTVMNLVVNSQDALPDGGRIKISTAAMVADALLLAAHPSAEEGRYVRLTVEDDGIGMDTDIRDRVFEPFFSTKNDPEKSGLGLATIYGVVQQHGGMIDLDSSPGAGTRFDIYFPAAEAPPNEKQVASDTATVGGQETILVVEDEAAVRHAQVEMLSALGYTVREAENGRLALELLRREHEAIDLVLSDVTMPEMGGRELFDRARVMRPDIPFVFSSGFTRDDLMDRLRDEERIFFIAKPYSLSQLTGIIRRALSDTPDTSV
jgi:two-component system cell cycle sensor histidine kinase/response regulator CckA